MASRTCWNCGKDAHQTPISDGAYYSAHGDFWTYSFHCDSCAAISVGKLPQDSVQTRPDQRSEAKREFLADGAPIEWLPVSIPGWRFDDVPNSIADAASEAYACYSIRSYRAAILLARSVIEAVAKDKGITKGNLASKIKGLEEQRIVSPLTAETAHEIRFIGNDMAHGDFVQTVTEEECDAVLNFMTALLEQIYQIEAKLSRFRSLRLKPIHPEQDDS